MSISLKTRKILWARSGNQCAICKTELIVSSEDSNDDASVVADEAHIVAQSESFTRGDYGSLSEDERDQYSNLILLCKNDHKLIDDQPSSYTVERLRELKAGHESEVRSRLTPRARKQQEDDVTYSGYVDGWQRLVDLDQWRNLSYCVTSADTPSLPLAWYKTQRELLLWTIGRIWPGRYRSLENAFHNYRAVVQDFLNEFDRHVDPDDERDGMYHTEKFYRIREWDPPRYTQLLREYNEHIDLLCDLFFELTRAANYVCDQVRERLFSDWRIREGALLVERHNVGLEMRSIWQGVEYRGRERKARPYPGLIRFKRIRYSRDCAIDPNPPSPPPGSSPAGSSG